MNLPWTLAWAALGVIVAGLAAGLGVPPFAGMSVNTGLATGVLVGIIASRAFAREHAEDDPA